MRAFSQRRPACRPSRPPLRLRLALAGLAGLAGVGCPSTAAVPSPSASPSASPARSLAGLRGCSAGVPFASLQWVPTRVRALTLVDLSHPDLAAALERLREGSQDPARSLPIRLAFSLGQWTWQVPMLRGLLADAGLSPPQLAHLALADGTSMWAWAPTCDLATLRHNLEFAWGLELRPTAFGALGRAPASKDGRPNFAYDVLVWGASAVGLVPAGRGATVGQLLAERRSDLAATGLQDAALRMLDAPVRLVMRTDDLIAPGVERAARQPVALYRIDGHGWSALDPAPTGLP